MRRLAILSSTLMLLAGASSLIASAAGVHRAGHVEQSGWALAESLRELPPSLARATAAVLQDPFFEAETVQKEFAAAVSARDAAAISDEERDAWVQSFTRAASADRFAAALRLEAVRTALDPFIPERESKALK